MSHHQARAAGPPSGGRGGRPVRARARPAAFLAAPQLHDHDTVSACHTVFRLSYDYPMIDSLASASLWRRPTRQQKFEINRILEEVETEVKEKKVRFGDDMGRIGRRRKGAGKLYDEEAQSFANNANDDVEPIQKRRRDAGSAGDLKSSMQSGRELKAIEDAAEDWEHSEDSGEEEYRRR